MQDDASLLSWVPRLRRYSRALVNNRDDADDLVQDTLERAWAKSSLWGGVADMRAWLMSQRRAAPELTHPLGGRRRAFAAWGCSSASCTTCTPTACAGPGCTP